MEADFRVPTFHAAIQSRASRALYSLLEFSGATQLRFVLVAISILLYHAAGADVTADAGPRASTLDPAVRAILAPVLSNWITTTRDTSIAAGVAPIPAAIRSALEGYVAEDVLDRVRWRVDNGLLSVPQGLFRLGYTPAMTLDYVVLFADEKDAVGDPKLWAQELFHVMQYGDWGVPGFAERYLADYSGVERDAAEFRWQFMRATGRIPTPTGAPIYPAGSDD
jgi:hypothetical protein